MIAYTGLEQEQTHEVTRVLQRLMGVEAYTKWAAHTWAITTTWEERHELAAAELYRLVVTPECGCVTPEQSCAACRAEASSRYQPDEIPYR